jgi:hypothetical protein
MIALIKSWFSQPTPMELIAKELASAYLSKLQGESGIDYAMSVVAYNKARIQRLETYLKDAK